MAASWAWRSLVIVGGIAVIGWVIAKISLVVIPVVVALLLTALLHPVWAWLVRHRVPRGLAAAGVLIGGVIVVAGVLIVVIRAFANGLPALGTQLGSALDKVQHWLETGPLQLSHHDVQKGIDSAKQAVVDNKDVLTSGALSTAVTVTHVGAGALVALFTLIFFLYDGRHVWTWLVRLLPAPAREPVDGAGTRAFTVLSSYVRATSLVALIDGAGIGGWSAILGVPLALPIGAVVFLAAFIPIVGATVSGLIAVLIALVAKGFWTAVLVLIGVLVVQQLEGHVLQPLLLGHAVRVHPLAVVLSIATGVVVAGIIGALVAVPIAACGNTAVQYLAHRNDADEPPVRRGLRRARA